MKHFSLARALLCFLLAVCPLLGHCGGTVEHGTETGNPPIVEQQKLHVVLRDTGVEVVGDAGAVSPGASVSVTNRSTGDRAEATARPDGSVSIVVPGSLQDEYEVTVSNGAGSQTLRIPAQTNGGAAGAGGTTGAGGSDATGTLGGSDLASASCDALETTLRESVSAAYSAASTACDSDSDCVGVSDVGCYYSCGGPVLSASGANAAHATILEETAPVCAELDRRCPGRGPPGCPPFFPPTTTGCSSGTCQVLTCDDLANRAVNSVTVTLNNAPRDCTIDADCGLIAAQIRCVADCGPSYYSVASGYVTQLNQSVRLLQDPLCTEFEGRPCPGPLQLPCPPPMATPQASCTAGQCQVTYVPLR